MGVNLDKMKRAKEEAASKMGSVDYWQIPVGESLLYVCPPLPGEDLPFVESGVHYDVGPDKKIATCLDEERNPVLKNPRVQRFLAEKGKDISGGCAVCRGLDEGGRPGREMTSRYFFGVIPLKYRKSAMKSWREADDADEFKILACGYTIWSGITDVFINNGDITDPSKAILIRLVREGSGMKTKYTISADTDSVRDGGVALSKNLRALVKKIAGEGEAGDLLRVISATIRSSSDVETLVTGVPMEEETPTATTSRKPECFGLDFDSDDSECKDCPHADDCERECSPPGAKPDAKSTPTPPPAPTVPPPPPAKTKGKPGPKPKAKPAPVAEPAPVADNEGGEGGEVVAAKCQIDHVYTESPDDDEHLAFKGTSTKGDKVWAIFEDKDGERVRFDGSTAMFEVESNGESDGNDDDDDDMAALDNAIANRKNAAAAKAAKASK